MAGVRMTGLSSGLDTESLVRQLSDAYQTKVDNVKKQQTKAEWKKEAWASLNTKLMDFYKGALSTFKSYSSYKNKAITGDLKGAKITASNSAVNGTHRVQVNRTAVAQMWTGKKVDKGSYTEKLSGSTKLSDMNQNLVSKEISINGQKITVGNDTTLKDLAEQMSKLGIEANYDAGQERFYLNAKNTGKDNGFTVDGDAELISALGLDLQQGDEGRIDAEDASIVYNGVTYEQSSNVFNINGLTIEAVEQGDSQTFSVGTDVQGIYDQVKNFISSYNTLVADMNTLYNADRLKDFEPLTDDEKSAMSDKDVENWEKKIKDSLLRRDETINSLLSMMRSTLNGQIQVTGSDGATKGYSLASFGIETGVYTEKGILHISGNKDDSDYADFDDKLMKAIMENPNAVEKTLAGIGTELYNKFQKAMASVEGMSSAMTFYNDKYMDDEIKGYKEKVTKEQEKMSAEEDKYYDQFSKMESAMAKLQAQQTYISQLFGTGA